MISMKKNHELFWILEVLLLTPIALFWLGVVSMYLGSDNLFHAVLGEPYSTLRSMLFTVICPLAAAWFSWEYIRENKKEKGATTNVAKYIIVISLVTLALVVAYLVGENKLL